MIELRSGFPPGLSVEGIVVLKKIVYWTGASDFLVGAGTMAGALQVASASEPSLGQFVPLMTLGMFLMLAAACLMWASHEMADRAPIIFWQGLVRLTAVCSVIYAVPNGLSERWEYVLIFIDGPIGLTYVIGAMKATNASFLDNLMCKGPRTSAA
jgi:hypothetical protein